MTPSARPWYGRPFVWLAGLLVAGGVVPAPPIEETAPTEITDSRTTTPMRVTVAAADRFDFVRTLDLSGLLAAREDISISTAIVGQRIAEVLVEVGDTVAQGQLLARLESDMLVAQVSRAEAAVAQARAVVAQAVAADNEAQSNLRRTLSLLAANSVSPKQADEARAAALGTAAAVVSAEAALLGADADLVQSRIERAKARILAPFAGTIASRNAKVGTLPDGTAPLFGLIRDSEVDLLAEVPERSLPLLEPGQKVTLTVNGLGHTILGHIRLVEPTIDPQSRLAIVRVALPVAADLRPGAFAWGAVDLGPGTFAVAAPETALRQRNGSSATVMVVDANGKVSTREVTVGAARDGMAEVLQGLRPGERVVRTASTFLNEGDITAPVEDEATASAATP
jgi:HlyD family secretion protein